MIASSYRAFVALIALIVVAACGGGGGGGGGGGSVIGGGGIGGTGISTGAVTGFGSVIVNGVKFDDSNAQVIIDDSGGNRSQLKVGQVVKVEFSANNGTTGTATKVTFDPNLRGQVTSVDAPNNSFTVLNQTIRVDDATKFDGIAGLSALSGAFVQVSGFQAGNGELVASHIQPFQSSTGEVELKGSVSAVSGTTFQIGGQTFDTAGSGLNVPAQGQCVEARGTLTTGAGTVTVTSIDSDDDCGGVGASVQQAEVEGIINSFASTANFKVSNQSVRTDANTSFSGGLAADLANGIKVEAEGSTDANGVLVAKKISFKSSVKIIAPADADAANNTVRVLGITVKATNATKGNLAIGSVQANDRIEVRGFKSGNGEVTALEIKDAGGGGGGGNRVELQGPLESKSDPELTILGVTIRTGNGTQFEGDRASFFANVALNTIVKAKGIANPPNAIDATGSEGEVEIED